MTKKLLETGIKTPILMLTALSSIKNKTEGLDAGADDYLTKPFALEELLARARALLRRPKETTEAVLQVGDLTLDPATHQVQRAEQNIELTNKEFSLLEYLMRNSGRALSKDQIITHVWNYDSDILPNNVEVYVKFLREKIDRPFVEKSQPLLKTIRGFGYKLEAN
jgi:two-component system, OmpR family, response regulator